MTLNARFDFQTAWFEEAQGLICSLAEGGSKLKPQGGGLKERGLGISYLPRDARKD